MILSHVQPYALDVKNETGKNYVLSNLMTARTFPHYYSLTGTTGGYSFEAKKPQHGLPLCLPRFPMARERYRQAEETVIKAQPRGFNQKRMTSDLEQQKSSKQSKMIVRCPFSPHLPSLYPPHPKQRVQKGTHRHIISVGISTRPGCIII